MQHNPSCATNLLFSVLSFKKINESSTTTISYSLHVSLAVVLHATRCLQIHKSSNFSTVEVIY